jgi:general secretion pathway protein I
MNRARSPLRNGFTLLEILVALAILAVALAAAMRVAGNSTNIVSEQKQRTLALWVAQNRLAEHCARSDWPDAGSSEGDAEQAGSKMRWQETVSGTPRGDFRRIEVRVFDAERKDYALTELVGFLVRAK